MAVVAIFVGRNVRELQLAGVSDAPRLLRAVEDALAGNEDACRRPSLSVLAGTSPNGLDIPSEAGA